MSENIRDINGKKYWKNYNITPTFKNEKFDFESYMPGKENSNVAEDIYFFLNSEGSYKDDNKLDIPYNEARDKVMKFYNDRIDDEMAKSAAGIDYYQNKLNSLNKKDKGVYRVQTQPAFTPKERLYKSNIDKYYKNMRKFAKMYDDIKNNENISPDTIAYIYNKYVKPEITNSEDQQEMEFSEFNFPNKSISNPYKLEPPENYLKEPVKTPTMEKVENIRDKGVKTGEIKAQKPKLKKLKKKVTVEIDDNLKKEIEYHKYLEKIVDDFKAKNPKANISEDENPKIWLLKDRNYHKYPNKAKGVFKKHPELKKDEDLIPIYSELNRSGGVYDATGSRN